MLSYTSGINTATNMATMISGADFVVLTRGDLVSISERKVLRRSVEMVNPAVEIIDVSVQTGEGVSLLAERIMGLRDRDEFIIDFIRGKAPGAYCRLCPQSD